MELPDYTIGKRYADLMKTMWFTFFYSPVIPFSTLISIIGLILYYWVDKYNIMRRRTVKESISKDLSYEMIENLELTIIWYTVILFNIINKFMILSLVRQFLC
jgi:hypothetical protein